MKRSLTLLAGSAVTLFAVSTAMALPPIPPYVAEHYAKDPNGAKITETLKMQTGKCAMCHIPGADKKAKGHGLNDFGKAVHDNLKHKLFMAEHAITIDEKATAEQKAAAKTKAMDLLVGALKKAEELKNADGKVFGDLIKAGTMPGNNPPAAPAPPAK
ncbi:hypothetical protein ETAA8_50440 [Anatilimnocola aggregata]|uniref:Cytochrome c domain-containing protein n=1 Tax=Anatilimnocola aggregata TaxID=2528021 RepID=A0A517YI66_9BACT|nr:hypothetical protein [Anatilimnocola aggregata]QDU29927.1 hypothetical protein ETAA8_50440 [Anatilimnocola aggregata]